MLEPWPICRCGDEFNPKRRALGYTTCMPCGAKIAAATHVVGIIEVPKSNPIVTSNPNLIREIGLASHKGNRQAF